MRAERHSIRFKHKVWRACKRTERVPVAVDRPSTESFLAHRDGPTASQAGRRTRPRRMCIRQETIAEKNTMPASIDDGVQEDLRLAPTAATREPLPTPQRARTYVTGPPRRRRWV